MSSWQTHFDVTVAKHQNLDICGLRGQILRKRYKASCPVFDDKKDHPLFVHVSIINLMQKSI